MSLESVYLQQTLNKMMKEQFYTYDIDTIMILGIAGGNGLEHICKDNFQKVYGVDVNRKYLIECKTRCCELEEVHHQMEEDTLIRTMVTIGYTFIQHLA